MQRKFISTSLGVLLAFFCFIFSFYNKEDLLIIWPNWILGHSFNLQILLLEIFFVFFCVWFLYLITGGERLFEKNNPQFSNNTSLSAANLLTQPVLEVKDLISYNTYKQQSSGPSIFKSESWKKKLSRKPVTFLKEEANLEQKEEKDFFNNQNSYLVMDLVDLEIQTTALATPLISLEKNIEILLSEQKSRLEVLNNNLSKPFSKNFENSLPFNSSVPENKNEVEISERSKVRSTQNKLKVVHFQPSKK